MRTQTITLTDTEAETLFGFVAELLDDNSGVSDDTRRTLDAIYSKLDDLSQTYCSHTYLEERSLGEEYFCLECGAGVTP